MLLLSQCDPNKQPGISSPTTSPDSLVASFVPFQPDWEKIILGEINLSFLLEKPAGKNGFVEIKDGHFYLPSGKRFRIWGVNLTAGACYPEKESATKVAGLLSSLGINVIRFHFLDSNWGSDKSIFKPSTENTHEFNPEQLDKLDFFVSELKKAGIYSNFNLNVGRNYRKGDKVPFYDYIGFAKGITLFDDRIIELQQEYAFNLLTHINPYTGNEYRNEPALAFIEIVNENSLVEAWFRGHLEGTHNTKTSTTWMDIPEFYSKELTEKYNEWLKKNLSESERNKISQEAGVSPGQSIPRLKSKEFNDAGDFRFRTEARFIIETEDAFYSGMYRYLKDSVKVNQRVAANSDHNHWKSGYALLSSTSKLDFVDGHVYWQHPNYFIDETTGKQTFSIKNTPMVDDPWHSTVAQLSRSAVEGKPYTVSETNHPFPNEYACEGIPVLGAYALFQDWDGIYFYTFEHDDPTLWKSKTPGYFDLSHDPSKLSNLAAVSIMFHRGDIAAGKNTVLRNYDETEIIEGIRRNTGDMPFFTPGLPPSTPLFNKIRIAGFAGGENKFPPVEPREPIISDTKQLQWYHGNMEGLVVINTDNTQALIGHSGNMNEKETDNMQVNIINPFASIFLCSLEEKAISKSSKMLLTVTSTSLLSGSVWNADRTSLLEWGHPPFMINPIKGSVTLANLKQKGILKITPLDASGQRQSPSNEAKIKGRKIIFDIGNIPSCWYLIELQ